MKNHLIQEVRAARAAVAADFNFDLHKFFAWAKEHTAEEREAKHWLPTSVVKTLETAGDVPAPNGRKKLRARAAGVLP